MAVATWGWGRMAKIEWAADSTAILSPTPLLIAAKYGHRKYMQELLERNDVAADSRSNLGQTPLSYGAANGRGEVVEQLVGSDSTAKNNHQTVGCA